MWLQDQTFTQASSGRVGGRCGPALLTPYLPPESRKKRDPWKHIEVLCSIPSRSHLSPSYFHSFGLTPHYTVFLEQPLKMDIIGLATAYFRGKNWASCLTFHKNDKVLCLQV